MILSNRGIILPIMRNKFNLQKYINAVLFFASQEKLGITKLNKLLYKSDFEHFRRHARPIIGDEYIKMKKGPVPEKSYSIFNSNFREEEDDSLKEFFDVQKRFIFDYAEKTIKPKREPDMDYFSKSEKEIMQSVSEEYRDYSATDMSELTHDESPWQNADRLENIDYLSVFDENSNQEVKEYAEFKKEWENDLEKVLN